MSTPFRLRALSNADLLDAVNRLAAEERRITLAVLEHFREIERRKAYADVDCKSLFEYAVRHLRYSEAAASRRIAAMRALREHPELAENIQDGRTTVTAVAKIQTTLRREEKLSGKRLAPDEKKRVFSEMSGLPARALERKLVALAPQAALPEKIRPVTESLHEVRIYLSAENLATLEEFRGLIAHSLKDSGCHSEVFKKLIGIGIRVARNERGEKPARDSKKGSSGSRHDASPPAGNSPVESIAGSKSVKGSPKDPRADRIEATVQENPHRPPSASVRQSPRHLPRQVRRRAFARADFRCEFHYADGKRCEAKSFLQVEHRTPYAKGGTHALSNLEILCRDHNLIRGIRVFGPEKMRRG